MRRISIGVMAILLVVGAIGSIPAAGTTASPAETVTVTPAQTENQPNENASSVTPGERLSGVVGVQSAEFEGELERRTFGIKMAKVASNESKANVIKAQLDLIESRLMALEHRKAELDAARENGSISEGQYRVEVAKLAARTNSVHHLTSDSEEHARGLPVELLENKNINVTAIQTLKQNAENLRGPEVAEIARSIAGGSAGPPFDRGPPPYAGPAGSDDTKVDNAIDRAEQTIINARDRLENARDRVDAENGSVEAIEALDAAAAALERAEQSLANARDAREAGDNAAALQAAENAIDHAMQSVEQAMEALARADQTGPDDDSDDKGNRGTDRSVSQPTGSS